MQKRVDELKKRFRILKDWKVTYCKPSKKNAAIANIGQNARRAFIYGWPRGEKEPKEFLIHEMLHVVAKALVWIDRRHHKEYHEMEEELVQDLCVLIFTKDKP